MTETASPMHQEPASAQAGAGLTCDTCRGPFKPRKGWQRFCSPRCRNAHHAAEARLDKIRKAAPALYEALRSIATNAAPAAADFAANAIKDLKPPVEPKALLEKAKA